MIIRLKLFIYLKSNKWIGKTLGSQHTGCCLRAPLDGAAGTRAGSVLWVCECVGVCMCVCGQPTCDDRATGAWKWMRPALLVRDLANSISGRQLFLLFSWFQEGVEGASLDADLVR